MEKPKVKLLAQSLNHKTFNWKLQEKWCFFGLDDNFKLQFDNCF